MWRSDRNHRMETLEQSRFHDPRANLRWTDQRAGCHGLHASLLPPPPAGKCTAIAATTIHEAANATPSTIIARSSGTCALGWLSAGLAMLEGLGRKK